MEEYAVKRFNIDESEGSYSMLEVKCPRKDCGRSFWVTGAWGFIEVIEGASDKPAARPVGRSCAYCQKVSLVPEKYRNYNPRRVVRRKKGKS